MTRSAAKKSKRKDISSKKQQKRAAVPKASKKQSIASYGDVDSIESARCDTRQTSRRLEQGAGATARPLEQGAATATGSIALASQATVNTMLRQTTLKAPTQRQKWIKKYEIELGLHPVRVGHEVPEAKCKFCSAFGREKKQSTLEAAAPSPFTRLLASAERKRTERVKVFKTFRRDNIVAHMVDQHPTKWAAFTALEVGSAERRSFFKPPARLAALLPCPTSISLNVPQGIVDVIRRLLCARVGDDDVASDHEARDFLGGLRADDFVELGDQTFMINISDRLQFETVIKCVNASNSFRGACLFTIFGEAAGSLKLGRPNERAVGRYVRAVVAISLYGLRTILSRVWGFSILVDGATHAAQGYLDTRISFALGLKICNYHLLAIPMGNRAHTASNYADLVIDVLQGICGNDILKKPIGIASDGAATMLGCRQGFAVQIRHACERANGGGVMVNWCGSHQLNLAVGTLVEALKDLVAFKTRLGAEISFTRTFESVRSTVGKCPTYADTRWESIFASCSFLAMHYKQLTRLQGEKGYQKSGAQWWLCLFAVADMAEQIKICFKRLQFKTVTMKAQCAALQDLAHSFQLRYEDGSNGATPSVSTVKVEQHLRCAALFSVGLYDQLEPARKRELVDGVAAAIKRFISDVLRIKIEVNRESSVEMTTTPVEMVQCSADDFVQLIDRHSDRLRAIFGPAATSEIWRQRNHLISRFETDSVFRRRVDGSSGMQIAEMWERADGKSEYKELACFAVGLASIPPGTHTVEGDFSTLKGIKDPSRSSLSNYALEGQLHAKQFFDVTASAAEVDRNGDIQSSSM